MVGVVGFFCFLFGFGLGFVVGDFFFHFLLVFLRGGGCFWFFLCIFGLVLVLVLFVGCFVLRLVFFYTVLHGFMHGSRQAKLLVELTKY